MDLKLEFKKEVLAFPLATFKTLDSHVKSLLAFSYESTELVENYAVEKREGICSRVMEMIRRFKRKVTAMYKHVVMDTIIPQRILDADASQEPRTYSTCAMLPDGDRLLIYEMTKYAECEVEGDMVYMQISNWALAELLFSCDSAIRKIDKLLDIESGARELVNSRAKAGKIMLLYREVAGILRFAYYRYNHTAFSVNQYDIIEKYSDEKPAAKHKNSDPEESEVDKPEEKLLIRVKHALDEAACTAADILAAYESIKDNTQKTGDITIYYDPDIKRKAKIFYKDREVYHPYNEEYNRVAKKPARWIPKVYVIFEGLCDELRKLLGLCFPVTVQEYG